MRECFLVFWRQNPRVEKWLACGHARGWEQVTGEGQLELSVASPLWLTFECVCVCVLPVLVPAAVPQATHMNSQGLCPFPGAAWEMWCDMWDEPDASGVKRAGLPEWREGGGCRWGRLLSAACWRSLSKTETDTEIQSQKNSWRCWRAVNCQVEVWVFCVFIHLQFLLVKQHSWKTTINTQRNAVFYKESIFSPLFIASSYLYLNFF